MTQPAQEDPQYNGGTEPEETMETSPDEAAAHTPPAEPSAEPGLQEQLDAERERSAGYLEELQRERASFINFRRRTDQEREGWSREANAALLFNLLSVLDDFERARDAIPMEQQTTPWVEGLMLVGRKLHSTLELAGLRQIEAVGRPFDPSLHEAVAADPSSDAEAGAVLEEYRKGYMLGDRVLRPSMVKVAG